MKPVVQPWTREGERHLLHTPVFEVCAARYRHPARPTPREFVRIDAADWVVAVALTPADEVVMVRQFRFGIAEISLELPGGIIESGEDPVAAARRELAEETGYVGTRARLLASAHPNPALQNNRNHIVLVEEARLQDATRWDADEELALELWPVEEALRAARDGRITHALMLNAFFFLDAHRRGLAGGV